MARHELFESGFDFAWDEAEVTLAAEACREPTGKRVGNSGRSPGESSTARGTNGSSEERLCSLFQELAPTVSQDYAGEEPSAEDGAMLGQKLEALVAEVGDARMFTVGCLEGEAGGVWCGPCRPPPDALPARKPGECAEAAILEMNLALHQTVWAEHWWTALA